MTRNARSRYKSAEEQFTDVVEALVASGKIDRTDAETLTDKASGWALAENSMGYDKGISYGSGD